MDPQRRDGDGTLEVNEMRVRRNSQSRRKQCAEGQHASWIFLRRRPLRAVFLFVAEINMLLSSPFQAFCPFDDNHVPRAYK